MTVPPANQQSGERAADPAKDAEQGHLLIWPGRAVYAGPVLKNETHAHHAIQISVALEGTLSLQAPPDRHWRAYRAVTTAPDKPHRLRCDGLVAQIYLDPESAAGVALQQRIGPSGIEPVDIGDDRIVAALDSAAAGALDAERVLWVIDELAGAAMPDPSSRPIDPRVRRVLSIIRTRPGERYSLGALAGEVGLSPSRLGALFRRDVGIPVRRYQLWLRLISAIEILSSRGSLTPAAHEAGFSDSAHLSRTFRRMFGMPPSALRAGQVEVHDLAAGSAAAPI
jgi:AraC-like DNA-binding protein